MAYFVARALLLSSPRGPALHRYKRNASWLPLLDIRTTEHQRDTMVFPNDVWGKILPYMDLPSLQNLRLANRNFSNLAAIHVLDVVKFTITPCKLTGHVRRLHETVTSKELQHLASMTKNLRLLTCLPKEKHHCRFSYARIIYKGGNTNRQHVDDARPSLEAFFDGLGKLSVTSDYSHSLGGSNDGSLYGSENEENTYDAMALSEVETYTYAQMAINVKFMSLNFHCDTPQRFHCDSPFNAHWSQLQELKLCSI